MKKHTPWVAALVLLLALWLASCGGGEAGGGAKGGGGGGSQTTVGKKATTAHTHEKTTAHKKKKRTAAHKKNRTAGGGASGGVIRTVTIKEVDFKLSPSSVTLSKPGTYSFKAENDGATQHSLAIEGKGLKSAGGQVGETELKQVLNPGQSGLLTLTFQKPDTYVMYCPIDGHEALGMKGEVVIK